MDSIRNSDFDIDLRFGQAGEVLVNSLLTAPIENVEVKRDRRWKETGNLYIETWCWSDNLSQWYPSGFATATATHWSWVLEEMVLTFPVALIKQTIQRNGHAIECSIPPNYSKGYLIKVTDLLNTARASL